MIYKILLEIVIVMFRIYCGIVHPVRVTGKENLPKEGGFMMCVNHISFLDPVITVLYVKRHIRFMGKKELFSNKIVAGVLNAVGAFPVDRGRADLAAIREAI
ncbi:MAG: 1-acyl-sn-glycerol-3-phosphate acyltransferase, partial [Clostridia bacterium]|nr:1-acyl-sn-glycerol-3-phosphate acyltransferase [Clostridia bacterium]